MIAHPREESFPETRRVTSTRPLGLIPALAGLVLLGWVVWLGWAEVGVHVASPLAQVEMSAVVRPVEVEVAGRVVLAHVALGSRVEAGDLLLQLDASAEEGALAAAEAELAGLEAQAEPLTEQRDEATRARQAGAASGGGAIRAARQALLVARSEEALAEEEVRRIRGLQGTVSEAEARAVAEQAVQARARRKGAEADLARLAAEARRDDAEAKGEVAALGQDDARLLAAVEAARATVQALEAALRRRSVRAPVAGRIGEAGAVAVGAVVAAGERVATLIPDGDTRVVASFPPESLGRLRPGQPGRMRVDAYDWVRFGTLPLEVVAVAGEARYGLLRVELKPTEEPAFPLQHGLSGTVEVEVERASPLSLLLRAAGAALGPAAPVSPR